MTDVRAKSGSASSPPHPSGGAGPLPSSSSSSSAPSQQQNLINSGAGGSAARDYKARFQKAKARLEQVSSDNSLLKSQFEKAAAKQGKLQEEVNWILEAISEYRVRRLGPTTSSGPTGISTKVVPVKQEPELPIGIVPPPAASARSGAWGRTSQTGPVTAGVVPLVGRAAVDGAVAAGGKKSSSSTPGLGGGGEGGATGAEGVGIAPIAWRRAGSSTSTKRAREGDEDDEGDEEGEEEVDELEEDEQQGGNASTAGKAGKGKKKARLV